MSLVQSGRSVLLLACIASIVRAQLLPSQAAGAARAQVAMLSVNGSVAAGIVAGFDADNIYIATAAHVANLATKPLRGVDIRFEDAPDTSRQGSFLSKFEAPEKGDLAVVVVKIDERLRIFLDGLDFAMLSPVPLPPSDTPATSIGYSGGSMWTRGTKESLLPVDRGYLRLTSDVGEGQSGGAVYNEAWELIGMAVDRGDGLIYARRIESVIESLKGWEVPVRLTARSLSGRVRGADELARENERRVQRALRRDLAQRLSTQSETARSANPVRALLLSVEAVNATRQDGIAIAPAREALAKSLQGASGFGLNGHRETIHQATFSGDDTLLATASRDGVIKVWSLADPSAPKCLKVIYESGQGDWVVSEFMAFDKQSKLLITQAFGRERHVTSPKVWRLNTPGLDSEATWLIPDHAPATALVASHARDLIAVADTNNHLSVHSLGEPAKKAVRLLSIPTGYKVQHMSFSRDDRVLIAGTSDAQVLVWDLSVSGDKPVAAFDAGHKQLGPFGDRPSLDLLDVNGDHSLLLTGSSQWSIEGRFGDPTLRVWPLRGLVPTGPPWIIDQSGLEPNKFVIDAFFDQTRRMIVGVTPGGTVKAWDLSKARFDGKREPETPFAQLTASGYTSSASRSLDRGLLALSDDGRPGSDARRHGVAVVRTRDLDTGRSPEIGKLSGLDSSVDFVKLSDSARFLVAGEIGGTARLWDLARVDPLMPSSSILPNPYSQVEAIQLSRTGRLVVALRGTSLEFWNIDKLTEPKLRYATDIDVKAFGDCIVCQIVISPDDRWIAYQDKAKDRSHIVEIGADGPARREFVVAARTWRNTNEILFSPDSSLLFIEEAQQVRVVYDLRTASPQRRVFSDSGLYFTPTFSTDGKWLYFKRFVNKFKDPIGRDKQVGFIAPTEAILDPTKRIPISGFATQVGSVVFSPDGRWLALSGHYSQPQREQDDRYVQLLRREGNGWTKYADLTPIEYAAQALRFSADGRWLFTGSGDITLRDRNVSAKVWDLSKPLSPNSGQQLPNVVWNLKLIEFSPDSKWLVTVSGAESYARLWTLKGEKLEFVSKLAGPQPHFNNHWFAVFGPKSDSVVLWTTDDATPFYWKLDGKQINELGNAIPNGDREIKDVEFVSGGHALTILNSGGTTTGTAGTAGAHFTFLDLAAFPAEDSYAAIPAGSGAYSHVYREDVGLILAAGETLVATATDLESQLRRAASVAGRNLSWDEWVKSGIGLRYHPTFPSAFVGADVIAAQTATFSKLASDDKAAKEGTLKQELLEWTRQLNDAETCNNLAWELANQGDVANSLDLVSRALRLVPDNPNYHDTKGVALALSGRRNEAIAEFEFFVTHAQGIERFALSIPVRRNWIELLRSGREPFSDGIK